MDAPDAALVAPPRRPAHEASDTACEECGEVFRTQAAFDQHHREAHPGSTGGRPLGV